MCVVPPSDLFPYHDIELDQRMRLTEEENVQRRHPSSVCVCHIALKINLEENDERQLWFFYGITPVMGV